MNNESPLFQDTAGQFDQPGDVRLPEMPPLKPSAKRIWLIAGSVIVFGVGMLFVWKLLTPPAKPTVLVILSPTPTPTPIRILSAVATTSAFLQLSQIQASLSAGLSATNLDDPSLSPPILVLPLGFKP